MKKLLPKLATAALLSLALAPGANAELLFSDNFDFPPGNLKGQGEWLQYGSNTGAPIQVVSQSLTYPGYQTAAVGGAIRLAGNLDAQDQSVFHDITGNDNSNDLFISALINVNSVPDNAKAASIAFVASNFSGFLDTKKPAVKGAVSILKGSDDNHFKLGVYKQAITKMVRSEVEFELGKTHCLVMQYKYQPNSNDDIINVWINSTEASSTPVLSTSDGTDTSASFGIRGITLQQAGSSANGAPTMLVDAVRGATDWASLFTDEGGDGPGTDPTVSMSATEFNDDPLSAFVTGTSTKQFTVRATGITEDISVTVSGSDDFSVEPATIAKEAALSAAGAVVTVTYNPTTDGTFQGTLTLTSGDNSASAGFTAVAFPVKQLVNSMQIANQDPDAFESLVLNSTVTISYIDSKTGTIYGYDMAGGVAFKNDFTDFEGVKVGDKIKKIFGYMTSELGAPYFLPLYPGLGTLVSEGNAVNATQVNLGDIATSPELYIHRLVTIDDVTFAAEEGAEFGTSSVDITSGPTNAQGKVLPFAGTDLVGTAVPATATSVTGICRSMSIATISPRSLADIALAPAGEPALDITSEQLFSDEAAETGKATRVLRFNVAASNLASPVSVYLTGANRGMFSIDTEEIPAGTNNAVVTVTYTPTAIGKHTARINFDTMPTELAKGFNFTFLAYDPENLPQASADTSELTAFEVATAGETQVQTINITSANLPDYGTIKVLGDANGAFTINSTMLMKSGTTALRVTFAPKSEGTFTERIEISGVKLPAQTITVTGTCGGSLPEQPVEGDELTFDTSAPLKLLNETFDGAADNKPLSIAGWVNNAAIGKRAWWGYDFKDGNKAAKVTAYDSQAQIGAEDPCQMLLLTPALDFANSASKLLTFRVMGQYMADGMTDLLRVVYCDVADGEPYFQELQGLGIPASADYNGEWIDYVVDFEGQDLADTFFIGFLFDSNRGRDNSVVYYVDNVTYGRTDVPQIKSDVRTVEVETETFATHTTEINVTGLNLTGSISLAMGGANPSNFTLGTSTLPAEGGSFTLSFLSETEGVHEAYVELKSAGAPTHYILLAYNAKAASGITAIGSDENGLFTVYDTAGVRVLVTSSPESVNALPAGLYIVNGQKYIVK